MIKLVAFDWNGTLLSDTIACWEGANVQLQYCGCKPLSLLKFRESFSIPVVNSLVTNGASRDFCLKNETAVAHAFHSFYEQRVKKARTRAGTRQTLSWLQNNNALSIIYSNHTLSGINSQLERLKIKNLIAKVLANSEVSGSMHNKKTKGERLSEFVKIKKYHPREIISIGDTEEEIKIGKHFGYHTVAITDGYNTPAMLKKQQPDFLIHNMTDLVKIVKKLNTKK